MIEVCAGKSKLPFTYSLILEVDGRMSSAGAKLKGGFPPDPAVRWQQIEQRVL